MATLISGSTGVNKITDGTITNADIASGAAIAGTKLVMPTGSVLQVVSNTFSTVATTSTTATEIFSLSITPSSTSSKILITGALHMYRNAAGHNQVQIYRAASSLVGFATKDGYGAFHSMMPLNYLDSPSTTSAVAYKIYAYIRSGESGTLNFGDGQTTNTVTLTEIAG